MSTPSPFEMFNEPLDFEALRETIRLADEREQALAKPVKSSLRFRRGKTCPICGGSDDVARGVGERCHGYLSPDKRIAYCTREECAGDLEPVGSGGDLYRHALTIACPCHTPHEPKQRLHVVAPGSTGTIDTISPYCDEHGKLLYEEVRYRDPKRFALRRPGSDGSYVWDLNGTRRVLYRLYDLHKRGPFERVFIVEGPKDADTLWDKTLPAVTNVCGAGKWSDDYAVQLVQAGVREAIVLRDEDENGRKHQQAVADSCRRHGLPVRCISLSDLEPDSGKDITAWLDDLHTVEELEAIVVATAPDLPVPIGPSITRDDDHIIFEWPDSPARYLVKPPFTGKLSECELSIRIGDDTPFWSRIDLSNFETRNRIARDQYPADEEKRAMLRQRLEVICRESARLIYRQSEPVTLTPRKPTVSPYLIDPLIVEGAINAVWAPLSHFKGWLALVCSAGLIQGTDPVPGVLRCASGRRPVLYLDWESTMDKFESRLYALGIPAEMMTGGWFRYSAMTAPLPQLASTIREYMREQERLTGLPPVLMIDSWAMACGTDRPEGAGATIPAMLALRSLGSTSLILGHTTKKDSDKKGARKRTFYGSIFNQNLARNNWEILGITKTEQAQGDQPPLRHAVQQLHFHRANDGRQDNPDINLIYTFTNERQGNGEVLARVECRSEADFKDDPQHLTIASKLLALYREHGDMTDAILALHIPMDEDEESYLRKRRLLSEKGRLILKVASKDPSKKKSIEVWGLPDESDPDAADASADSERTPDLPSAY